MRQEICHLIHQVDAQFVILDTHMDTHATNDQEAHNGLHIMGNGMVALSLGVALFRPM